MSCPINIEEIKQRLDGTPSCFNEILTSQIKQRERAIPDFNAMLQRLQQSIYLVEKRLAK
jgi:hypothetical protein